MKVYIVTNNFDCVDWDECEYGNLVFASYDKAVAYCEEHMQKTRASLECVGMKPKDVNLEGSDLLKRDLYAKCFCLDHDFGTDSFTWEIYEAEVIE